MKNLNKDDQTNFEKSWKEAFEGAETEPSDDVWLKIDNVLTNQESKGLKKTIVFYRYAAAVSLILLLSTAVISYYLFNTDNHLELAGNEKVIEDNVQSSSQVDSRNTAQDTEAVLGPSAGEKASDNIIKEERAIVEDQYLSVEDNKGLRNEAPGNHSDNEITNENKEKTALEITKVDDINLSNENTDNENKEINNTFNRNERGVAALDGNSESRILSDNEKDKKDIAANTANANRGMISKEDQQISVSSSDEKNEINPNDRSKGFAEATHIDSKEGFTSLRLVERKNLKPFIVEQAFLEKEVYRVPVSEEKRKNKSISSNDFFAGVQFSPGYFDPNIQINPGNSLLSANRLAYSQMGVNPSNQEQNLEPQMSYTYGLNFGLKVSRRWLLNLGVQYAQNNTTGVTQQFYQGENNTRFLATPTTLNHMADYAKAEAGFDSAPQSMTPVTLNNNFEFGSIPVKAGFVVIDKKISWIISTGVATDFFIKNEIQDKSHFFEKSEIVPGESSPFRNIFFNGLASSEIVYHFTKNYSVSLEPNFRTAISSFSKSDNIISSRPKSFGVAAGFRFNF